MGAESLLHFLRVRDPQNRVSDSLVVLLVALVLLAFAAFLAAISADHSPASEPLLMGPFRWDKDRGIA